MLLEKDIILLANRKRFSCFDICTMFTAIDHNRNKNQRLDLMSPSFPIRIRSTARKPNNDCKCPFSLEKIHRKNVEKVH